ncbi:MAG TPA: glycosyltransferase [Mucilaginibacter sp.]|jgi:glycosyltransferase involved in cell wall biosynthesis|nr:glycosyltransferase [Mucilaginibacter sp.]
MKKRILFIITKSETGGAQKFVYEQIIILSDTFDVYLASNKKGWLTDNSADKVKSFFLDQGIEHTSITYLFRLRQYIKENKIDLVICNSANGGFYGRLASFLICKAIYISHGWSSVYNGGKLSFILNFIERQLSFITTSILCISKNDYNIAIMKIKIPERKLTTINNAILPFKNSIPNKFEKKQTYKLITLARLAKPKRIDLLIQAVKDISYVQLIVVGDGPDSDRLKKNTQDRCVTNVLFLGEIKSFDKFSDYDFFVLISDSEGMPMSAIEAMSFGMPLILSNVGGCSQLISNSGVLVENEIDSIKKGILECIKNGKLFSRNSFIHYQANFNLLIKKGIFINYYRSIINN